MSTLFDVITVTCFAALAIAFFQFTDRNIRILIQFVLVGIVFAIGNQVGNAGATILALILLLVGAIYAVSVVRR